jgi:hypothetical protein
MRWVLSETRAYKSVLSTREDYFARLGARSTSVLLKAGCNHLIYGIKEEKRLASTNLQRIGRRFVLCYLRITCAGHTHTATFILFCRLDRPLKKLQILDQNCKARKMKVLNLFLAFVIFLFYSCF